MGTPLDPDFLKKLLEEEKTKVTRGPKVDPTLDRSYMGWFKLDNHICTPDCPHRTNTNNPTALPITNEAGALSGLKPGAACWNPNCLDDTRIKDPNDPKFDRGIYVVSQVKGQWICRYCYLGGYLL